MPLDTYYDMWYNVKYCIRRVNYYTKFLLQCQVIFFIYEIIFSNHHDFSMIKLLKIQKILDKYLCIICNYLSIFALKYYFKLLIIIIS